MTDTLRCGAQKKDRYGSLKGYKKKAKEKKINFFIFFALTELKMLIAINRLVR